MGRGRSGTLGADAESLAQRYLAAQGLRTVNRNFRRRGGEIDLVMLDHRCLIFVEVRCRASSRFTDPGDTVDTRKQRKLVRTAALFLACQPRYANHEVRFDVVSIVGDGEAGGEPAIRWIRDAFRPNDALL